MARWVALAILGMVLPASASASSCDMLTDKERDMVEELIGGPIPASAQGEPCDQPQERCPIGLDLLEEVCRWVWEGKSRSEIKTAIAARTGQTATNGVVDIDLDEATRAGPASAPVTLVEYACPRCPFCKGLTIQLHQEVTAGRLEGKVKLYFRPFPLRNHPGAKEGGMGMIAAAKLGRFWPFLLRLYEGFDSFAPERLPGWAAAVGIDEAAFKTQLKSPQTRTALVASYKEGRRNGVDATPTLFINGAKYDGRLDIDTLVEVLSEAHAKAKAKAKAKKSKSKTKKSK